MVPLDRGALMITRRTLDGAEKCALRLFLRLECVWLLIFVMAAVLDEGAGGGRRSVVACRRLAATFRGVAGFEFSMWVQLGSAGRARVKSWHQ